VEMRKKAENSLLITLKELARSKAELEQIVFIASRDFKSLCRLFQQSGHLGNGYKGKFLDKDAWEIIGTLLTALVGMPKTYQ